LIGAEFAGDVGVWLNAGMERARTHGPMAGCVAVLRAVLEVDDRVERIACLLSDIVLARALNWKVLLPVTAQRLTKTALRDLTANRPEAELTVQVRTLESIEETIRVARDLARRAEALRTIAPKLRAKGSDAAVDLFLTEDAVTPASMLPPRIRGTSISMTDRAAAVLRPAGRTRRSAGADRAGDLPALWDRIMAIATRKRKPADEGGAVFDRELDDLPRELRWREWMGRIEAVLFASASPVGREDLARLVG